MKEADGVASGNSWTEKAAELGRDGYVLLPGMIDAPRLSALRAFADSIALEHKADYPDADIDVGFAPHSAAVLDLMDQLPARPLLQHFLGEAPVFVTAWQRVALQHSDGGVWHQDLQREIWPPALNVAIYLDAVTPRNGPTLVVPGTHVLPHPEFDRRVQPKQTAVLGPAGTVAVFFSTVWHRAAANTTDQPRRALFIYYRAADAIRVRRAPDPATGQGWKLGDAGPLNEHWSG
jgi:hypothetical protein